MMGFDRHGFDREVGLRLQLARKRRGMTQGVLAAEMGLQRASYANVEAGRQRIPVDVLWRAAIVLGVSISSLVPEAAPRTKQPSSQDRAADGTFSTSVSVTNSSSEPTVARRLTDARGL